MCVEAYRLAPCTTRTCGAVWVVGVEVAAAPSFALPPHAAIDVGGRNIEATSLAGPPPTLATAETHIACFGSRCHVAASLAIERPPGPAEYGRAPRMSASTPPKPDSAERQMYIIDAPRSVDMSDSLPPAVVISGRFGAG